MKLERLLDSEPGIYALLFRLSTPKVLPIGKFGKHQFDIGYYQYIGSAKGPGGLRARVRRHLRSPDERKNHWHIDAMTVDFQILELWWASGKDLVECRWVEVLESVGVRTPKGFGASDCRCGGHLIYYDKQDSLIRAFCILDAHVTDALHRIEHIDE